MNPGDKLCDREGYKERKKLKKNKEIEEQELPKKKEEPKKKGSAKRSLKDSMFKKSEKLEENRSKQ